MLATDGMTCGKQPSALFVFVIKEDAEVEGDVADDPPPALAVLLRPEPTDTGVLLLVDAAEAVPEAADALVASGLLALDETLVVVDAVDELVASEALLASQALRMDPIINKTAVAATVSNLKAMTTCNR